MIALPFVVFSSILVYIYRRNRVDICFFITLLYAITSFFAIILHAQDVDYGHGNYSEMPISIVPAFLYCFLIALCILPFARYNSNIKRKVSPIRSRRLFYFVSWLYIAFFWLYIILHYKDFVYIYLFEDLSELRRMKLDGTFEDSTSNLTGPLRYVASIVSVFGEGAYMMIPFFFYHYCFENKNRLFSILLLLSSLTPVLMGIVGIDRSKTFYWIILFSFSFMWFRKYFSPESYRKIKILIVLLFSILTFYFLTVSIARFGEKDTGVEGGLLSYIGQPFINFCYIWDNFWTDIHSTKGVFPITNYILGTPDKEPSFYGKTNVELNVFFTFLGYFLRELGHLWAVVIPLLIFLATTITMNILNMKKTFSLSTTIIVFLIATIVLCGPISYYYTTLGRNLCFLCFLFIAKRV